MYGGNVGRDGFSACFDLVRDDLDADDHRVGGEAASPAAPTLRRYRCGIGDWR